MSNSISRLKNTDSLSQWAEKINAVINTLELFAATSGTFTSNLPTISDLIVYDGSWQNKTLIGDIVIDTTFSSVSEVKFRVNPTLITDRTAYTNPDSVNDYLLIYDNAAGVLKKIAPTFVARPGGSANQVQFNLGGTNFMGATGFTFDGTRLAVPTISVNGNTIHTNEVTNRVGINNSTPNHTLDVAGDISTSGIYRIGNTSVLSSTTLGSSVVNSSLTTLGTIVSLSAGTGTFSGAVGVLSLTSSTSVTTNTLSVVAGATIGGILTSGSFSTTGTAALGNTSITGTLTTTGEVNLSTTTGVIRSGPQGNATIVGDYVPTASSISLTLGLGYLIRANGITLTLPNSGRIDGDRISFVPFSNSINNYTINRNGATIMGLAENLIVDIYAPFSLQWDGTANNWVIA